MPLVPAWSAFKEHSKQRGSPRVTIRLHVALAAIHFCLGKVKPKAEPRYLLSYGQFAAPGGMVAHHQDPQTLLYLNSA